jgi:prevent-host-death family protein
MKRLSVREARANLADVLGAVYYTHEPVTIERKGRAMAVLVSPEQFERFQRDEKERFFETVRELQRRNADVDLDEALRDVTEIVEEVRRERYEREQHGR